MVKGTGSAAKVKGKEADAKVTTGKEQPLEYALGALLYYDQKKGSEGPMVPFNEAPEAEQKKFILHASKVLLMLDQLNKMVVPRILPGECFKERMANVENIASIIRAFLPKVTKPPKVAKFFPVDELAVRIVEGRLK